MQIQEGNTSAVEIGIDYFTYSADVKYNKGKKPLISGTIQAYLKDAGQRLFETKKSADKMGLPIGFKLVRGAYCPAKENWLTPLVLSILYTIASVRWISAGVRSQRQWMATKY
ncbi:hypothetical protein L1987_13117 [Smallanthus sonchifolius]|uniref:Uncharacterized protein n=1 Tax=Smallanthus sonchifolius TaxID=185202 RepID=A0ACB9JGJ9_9ASTR|nr:hypothetical protein L1987_13117 [Smallanthus sonchifolius]